MNHVSGLVLSPTPDPTRPLFSTAPVQEKPDGNDGRNHGHGDQTCSNCRTDWPLVNNGLAKDSRPKHQSRKEECRANGPQWTQPHRRLRPAVSNEHKASR